MEKKINQKKLKNFIDQCINQCEGKEFIFRGTTQRFSCDENGKPRKDGVSSSLYREHKDIFIEHFHPIDIEKEYVERAKAKCFPKKTSNIEILTEICHFHGKTTLIDFTKNIHIALFFACDGEFEKNGELLYLDTQKMKQKGDIDYDITDEKGRLEAKRIEPAIVQTSRNRVIFQSSVFVHAPEGYINQDTLYCREIPSDYKKQILEYLRTCHNIYADTIYNDLLGFIMNQENYKTAHVEFYTGLSSQKNEKHKEAIQHYDEAIRLKPDDPDAYNNRGNAKCSLGLHKEAIQDYDEAIRIKPDDATAYSNRGFAKYELGLHKEAIQDYDEAIKLKPDVATAYNNRGNAKCSLGLHKEAIQDYDEAIRINPDDASAYYNRGNAKYSLGLYEEAIQDYDEAIRLKPDDADAYNNRALAKKKLDSS